MDTDYKYEPKNGLTKWLDSRLPLMRFTSEHVLQFPTPKNLNYFWSSVWDFAKVKGKKIDRFYQRI